MSTSWLMSWILRSALFAFLVTLAGCAGATQNTPIQAATYEAGGICSARIPQVTLDRVEPDGRYWWRGTTDSNASTQAFQECMGTERSKIMYAKASPKDLVQKAYLTQVVPPANVTLVSGPPPATDFKVDQPVIFYLELRKSGRTIAAKFKWYDPKDMVAFQNDRTFPDSGGAGESTWFLERLPSASVRQPGQWTLEVIFDEQVVGRYPFTVSQ